MAPSRAFVLLGPAALPGIGVPVGAPAVLTSRRSRAFTSIRATSSNQDNAVSFSSKRITTQHGMGVELVDGRNGGQEMDSGRKQQSLSLLATVVAVGAWAVIGCTPPNLANAEEGAFTQPAQSFQRTCAGCHAGGGNILQPNATLFAKDLDRNGLASVDDIFQTTYGGKGRMPGYGEKCTPRGQCTFGPRLSDTDIRALAEFVRLQADQGWPK